MDLERFGRKFGLPEDINQPLPLWRSTPELGGPVHIESAVADEGAQPSDESNQYYDYELATPEDTNRLRRHARELLYYGRDSISCMHDYCGPAGVLVFMAEDTYEPDDDEVKRHASISFFDSDYTGEFEDKSGLIIKVPFYEDKKGWNADMTSVNARKCYDICKQTVMMHYDPNLTIELDLNELLVIRMFVQLCEANMCGDRESEHALINENDGTEVYEMVRSIAQMNAPQIERKIYERWVDRCWSLKVITANPVIAEESERSDETDSIDYPQLSIVLHGEQEDAPDHIYHRYHNKYEEAFEDDGEPGDEPDEELEQEDDNAPNPVFKASVDMIDAAMKFLLDGAEDFNNITSLEMRQIANFTIGEAAREFELERRLNDLIDLGEQQSSQEDWTDIDQLLTYGFPSERTAIRLSNLYEAVHQVERNPNKLEPGADDDIVQLWFSEPVSVCFYVNDEERLVTIPPDRAMAYCEVATGACRARDAEGKEYKYFGPLLVALVDIPKNRELGNVTGRTSILMPLKNALKPIATRASRLN